MAKTAEVATAMEKTEGAVDLRSMIEKSAKELGRALPDHMKPERLVRIALTNVRMNPVLAQCTPASFLGSLFVAAQIGIEPIAGRAYLLPFVNKRQIDGQWKSVRECQFIMGYKGLAELFYRHEKAVELAWGVVHKNDDFDYQLGTDAFLKHKPAPTGRGEAIGFYVCAKLNNGGRPFMYMSREDCMEHGKKHSKTYDKGKDAFSEYSPWSTNPDSMCLKTVLIQLAKLLPLSVELQRAIQADESSHEYRKGMADVIDSPDTAWTAENAQEKGGQDISDKIGEEVFGKDAQKQ